MNTELINSLIVYVFSFILLTLSVSCAVDLEQGKTITVQWQHKNPNNITFVLHYTGIDTPYTKTVYIDTWETVNDSLIFKHTNDLPYGHGILNMTALSEFGESQPSNEIEYNVIPVAPFLEVLKGEVE